MKFSKIYTGGGDDGTTALWRGGRVSKGSDQVRTVAKFDKLNASLGYIKHQAVGRKVIQSALMNIMTKIMSKGDTDSKSFEECREKSRHNKIYIQEAIRILGETLDTEHPEGQKDWVYPGDNQDSLSYHVLGTLVREAEVELNALYKIEDSWIDENDLAFMNALSKTFYLWARKIELGE